MHDLAPIADALPAIGTLMPVLPCTLRRETSRR